MGILSQYDRRMCSSFRNADAVNQMAVCPGSAADPLPSTSESPQNKEVAVTFLLFREDLIDISH